MSTSVIRTGTLRLTMLIRKVLGRVWDFRLTVALTLVLSINFAFFSRPVQDDYVVLRDLASGSLFNPITHLWNHWGGNISAAFLVNLLLGVQPFGNFLFGIALQSILTLLLSVSSLYLIIKWSGLPEVVKRPLNIDVIIFISLISLGGFFSPAYIGIFNFSWASIAHFWPVLILIHSYYFSTVLSGYFFPVFFLLGFLAGNLNVTESAFIVLSSAFILHRYYFFHKKDFSFRVINIFTFHLGALVGLLTICLAPGFRERASIIGGPNTPLDFIERFLRCLIIDVGDLVSHPSWILGLVLGLILKFQLGDISLIKDLQSHQRIISLHFIVLFMLVVFGDTVAYPAWYHTIPLYILSLLTFTMLGINFPVNVSVGKNSIRKLQSIFFVFFIISVILVSRDLASQLIRANSWDKNFDANVCLIENLGSDKLLGASLTYPPLSLGVEDVDLWPWISSAYVDWVKSSGFRCTE
jgi:hypothetical protein